MADARPEVTAVLVAGWPAAAFAVSFELLLQQRRIERPKRTSVANTPALEDRTDLAVMPEPSGPVHPIPPTPERLIPAVHTVQASELVAPS
jgi:hypothetical protein